MSALQVGFVMTKSQLHSENGLEVLPVKDERKQSHKRLCCDNWFQVVVHLEKKVFESRPSQSKGGLNNNKTSGKWWWMLNTQNVMN